MRTILLTLMLALAAIAIQAQTPLPPELKNPAPSASPQKPSDNSDSAATADALQPTTISPAPAPQRDEKKVADAKFLALMMAVQVSTVVDIESTFHTIGQCPPGYTCREGNPLLRPFIQSGRPAVYAFTTGINGLVMWHSYRMKKRGSRWWWVGPAIQIGVHTWAAVHNYRTASRPALGPLPVR